MGLLSYYLIITFFTGGLLVSIANMQLRNPAREALKISLSVIASVIFILAFIFAYTASPTANMTWLVYVIGVIALLLFLVHASPILGLIAFNVVDGAFLMEGWQILEFSNVDSRFELTVFSMGFIGVLLYSIWLLLMRFVRGSKQQHDVN